MSEKAERVCAILVCVELVMDLLIVMATESGSLRGPIAYAVIAAVLLLQLTTILYIKIKLRKKEGADGTVDRRSRTALHH